MRRNRCFEDISIGAGFREAAFLTRGICERADYLMECRTEAAAKSIRDMCGYTSGGKKADGEDIPGEGKRTRANVTRRVVFGWGIYGVPEYHDHLRRG